MRKREISGTGTGPQGQDLRVQHNNNNNYNGALVARGGPERSFPTMRHDTLRDRRKGDP